jgi:hypothetical protein
MLYQITRGGQTYGPYTLSDLNRYVQSGHVLLSDLAKSDEMAEWVPVSQIVAPGSAAPAAAIPVPVAAPVYTAGYAQQQPVYGTVAEYPDPPNLHWALVLVFNVLTSGLFQMLWNLIVAAWMRRVQPSSKALFYYLAGYALLVLFMGFYIPAVGEVVHHALSNDPGFQPQFAHPGLMFLAFLGHWVFKLIARFDVRRSLEDHFNTVEPIGFRMSGVLTFFFGGLYIQAQLNSINAIKRAMRYGQYGR